MWDLRALRAADLISEERADARNPVAGFYPSLHLNLGECYRKLDDLGRAREHLERGRAAVPALGDDSYGRMIRDGLDRLAERLPSIRLHADVTERGHGRSSAAGTGAPHDDGDTGAGWRHD